MFLNRSSSLAVWSATWAATTAGAAAIATLVDAALLEKARSYFTGGFLAADHVVTASQGALFVVGSLVADAGALGIVTGVVLWAAARLGVTRIAAAALAGGVALSLVAAVDFAEYELASYFGDAFDLQIFADLTGRDFSEFAAVAWEHVVALLIAVGALIVFAAGAVYVIRRYGIGRAGRRPLIRQAWGHPSVVTSMAVPVALLIAAATVTTLMRRGSDVLDNGLRRKPAGQWLGGLVNRISDVDGDGYGVLGRPPDHSLFDGRERPYALDQPGNQIDEDGVAGDLPAGAAAYTEPTGAPPRWPSRPDVILFVLESFRADVLGSRVGGVAVTPVLDALVAAGVSSDAAYSHNGYTIQARYHIFSGSIAGLRGGTTLIDDFHANGYQTAYFSGQNEAFGGKDYAVGFDRADVAYDARVDRDKRYSTFSTAGSLAVPGSVVVERVRSFLQARTDSRPLFLYVNFHDTHFPYHHDGLEAIVNRKPLAQARIAPSRAAELRATYLNTAANVDRAIGQVLEAARAALGREPGIVVVGDHGESLFDEGFLGHGYALNQAQTRVPLVVAGLPLTLKEPVGQADLRDALRQALAEPVAARPRIEPDPAGHVFQYLGTLDRPAQIAFTGLGRQLVYDFRERRVRVGTEWIAPSQLSTADAAQWRALVETWERMKLARAARSAQ